MEEKKAKMAIVATVWLVAIVGLGMLVMNANSDNLVGQAIASQQDFQDNRVSKEQTTERATTRCFDRDAHEENPYEVDSFAIIQEVLPDGSIGVELDRHVDICVKDSGYPQYLDERYCEDGEIRFETVRCDRCHDGKCYD